MISKITLFAMAFLTLLACSILAGKVSGMALSPDPFAVAACLVFLVVFDFNNGLP